MTGKRKAAVVSLGCAKNLVDTENMLGLLSENGFEFTTDEHNADLLLVNTCGFIESAKEESIEAILNLADQKKTKNSKLIVTGCLAQRYKDELMKEIPEIDAIIGTGGISQVINVVEKVFSGERINAVCEPGYENTRLLPRILSNPGQSVYLKIAEGCNNRCAYCAIPSIRGPYRSKPMELIEQEAVQLIQNGAKEILLVAQDTTRYGFDLYQKYLLPELASKLAENPGLTWLRIMYCYPTYFTDELIQVIANEPKICNYIDLPLQHASDKILKAMHRRGSVQDIKNLIEKLRAAIPDLTLRTSFIVGFPGETEADFQELLNFMQEIKFDRVGVFKYSQEEGTPAAEMSGQIDEETKEDRYNRAMELQQKISHDLNQKKIGRTLQVLVEGELSDEPGTYVGRSEGDAPEIDGLVYFKAGRKVHLGELVKVEIKSVTEYDLMGVLK